MLNNKLLFFSVVLLVKFIFAENDTLVVNNGDKLVGEIKNMYRGVLVIETDYGDSDFNIEWDKVTEIHSQRDFIVSLSLGQRYYGTVNSDPASKGDVIIKETYFEHKANLSDIVYLNAVKKDFISRLSLMFDLGFSLTKANNLKQFSTRTNAEYQTETWSTELSFDAVRSAQDNVDETKRTDASANFKYFLEGDWFVFASGGFLQNDEQKLKSRYTPSTGAGKYFIHSNEFYFGGSVGVGWSNEKYNDSLQTHRQSTEGVAGLELNMFDMGDLGLLTNIIVYPNFTEKGRIRVDFKFDLKYDLPMDFYIRLGYTLNFDNQPVEGASKSDYVLQTSFGWEL